MTPTFSLCHATARLPNGWRKAYECWRERADDWSKVEYILGVDECDVDKLRIEGTPIKLAVNYGRPCANHAWNAAGKASTGRFLITAADDMFPPEHWDTELLKVIPSLDGEYVIEVKSGTSPHDEEWSRMMLHSFMTRPYYERIGNLFYPEYSGYYGDADLTEMARSHGVVIDARHLTFKHKHWIGTSVERDEVYARQDSDANRELGMAILGRRRENGFKGGNRLP